MGKNRQKKTESTSEKWANRGEKALDLAIKVGQVVTTALGGYVTYKQYKNNNSNNKS